MPINKLPIKLFQILFPILFVFHIFPLYAYLPETKVGDQNQLPEAIEGVGIDEKLNTSLPGDLSFTNDRGEVVKISDFYNDRRPVILSLVYYSCPSLCNLHLKGVFEVFKELELKPGRDFEFLAVTIDSQEGVDLASAKKATYVTEFLGEQGEQGIHFLTGPKKNIKKLTQAVGFKYKWNEEAKEWAHASAAIVSTPKGLISRYLHGVFFDPKTFQLSVVEASRGLVGSFVDNFALFCFRYDPKKNKYTLYIVNILRGVASLVLLLVLLWLGSFWWRTKKQNLKSSM